MCSTCIAESTRDLGSVQSLRNVIQENSETASTALLQITKNLQNYIGEVTDLIKKDDHEIKADLDEIVLKLNETKNKVIHLFEVLENNIQTDGTAIKKEIAIENDDKLTHLRDTNRSVEIIRYVLENFIADITPVQASVCINEIKRELKRLEKDIMQRTLFAKSKKISLKTTDMLNTLKCIGPNETSLLASVDKTVTQINLPSYKRNMSRNKKFEKSGVYKILPRDMLSTKSPTYNGILFLPHNQFLLADSYYGFYCLADDTKASVGSYQKYIDEKGQCTDYFSNLRYATYMANSTLALCIPSHREITFVTADKTFTVRGKIDCARTPKAIFGLNNGDLTVSWSDPVAFGVITGQLGSYKEIVYFTSDKSGRQLKSFDYMAIDEERGHVIQPCSVDKAVYCFNFDGQPIFKYISPELNDPKGVGVDYEGNTYVCDTSMAGGIHVVSPEGNAVCVIKEGCPETPLAIGFSMDKKRFAVTQEKGSYISVHFFSVVSE